METLDEELEWREQVHQAKRADSERVRRANRPFWMIILEQILAISWQLVVGILIIALIIHLAVQAYVRHISASFTPM